MTKIVTMCKHGLVRSVGLADVLKLHFEPVDVIPIGYCDTSNSNKTREMLFTWADNIIVMQEKYRIHVPVCYNHKLLVCEVGEDSYGNSHNKNLINKVWTWARQNQIILNITEHNKAL